MWEIGITGLFFTYSIILAPAPPAPCTAPASTTLWSKSWRNVVFITFVVFFIRICLNWERIQSQLKWYGERKYFNTLHCMITGRREFRPWAWRRSDFCKNRGPGWTLRCTCFVRSCHSVSQLYKLVSKATTKKSLTVRFKLCWDENSIGNCFI